jgi:hypothetical protein
VSAEDDPASRGLDQPRIYRLLDDTEEDRVSLREIVPDGGTYWRRRFDPTAEKQQWDVGLTASTIARAFYKEVFGKLGLT